MRNLKTILFTIFMHVVTYFAMYGIYENPSSVVYQWMINIFVIINFASAITYFSVWYILNRCFWLDPARIRRLAVESADLLNRTYRFGSIPLRVFKFADFIVDVVIGFTAVYYLNNHYIAASLFALYIGTIGRVLFAKSILKKRHPING